MVQEKQKNQQVKRDMKGQKENEKKSNKKEKEKGKKKYNLLKIRLRVVYKRKSVALFKK